MPINKFLSRFSSFSLILFYAVSIGDKRDLAVSLSVLSSSQKHSLVIHRKLVIGLAFKNPTFVTNKAGNIGDSILKYREAETTYRKNREVDLKKICQFRKATGWSENYDQVAAQVIGRFKGDDGLTCAVTFDSPRSIARKVKYAMETRLGGFWLPYLSSDDVDGECEADEITFADFYRAQSVVSEKKDFLLLRTINQAKDLLEKN